MRQSEALISKALTDARERLQSLQSEVQRYEQIVNSLEEAEQLENGQSRQKRKYTRKAERAAIAPGEVIGWPEAIQKALSGGVLHTRRTLAQAAQAIRKEGTKGAAYQGMLHALRAGRIAEASSGVITWIG